MYCMALFIDRLVTTITSMKLILLMTICTAQCNNTCYSCNTLANYAIHAVVYTECMGNMGIIFVILCACVSLMFH